MLFIQCRNKYNALIHKLQMRRNFFQQCNAKFHYNYFCIHSFKTISYFNIRCNFFYSFSLINSSSRIINNFFLHILRHISNFYHTILSHSYNLYIILNIFKFSLKKYFSFIIATIINLYFYKNSILFRFYII